MNDLTYPYDKKVRVEPILREGGWLGSKHDGSFMYSGTFRLYNLPREKDRNEYFNLFSVFGSKEKQNEIREKLEYELGLPKGGLLPSRIQGNYFSNFFVRITRDGLTLDLSRPSDFLRFLVLRANDTDDGISPSWENRYNRRYKFAIAFPEDRIKQENQDATSEMDAYILLGSMKSDAKSLRNFIEMYRDLGKTTIVPSKSSTQEWLFNEVSKIVKNDSKSFLSIIKDEDYTEKAILMKAIKFRIVEREDATFITMQGEDKVELGDSKEAVVSFFKAPENQDVYLSIQKQIEVAES